MRHFIFITFALFASLAAQAEEKVVDCNIPDGEIAQVTVMRARGGAITASLLTSSGSWLKPIAVSAADWQKRDLNLRFPHGRIRFYQDGRRHWSFEEFDLDSTQSSVLGDADCE